jgi:hypothetical protein
MGCVHTAIVSDRAMHTTSPLFADGPLEGMKVLMRFPADQIDQVILQERIEGYTILKYTVKSEDQ